MNGGIYKITNKKNGKFYIGSSKNIKRRWVEHKNDLNNNQHINPKLQNAWNFYGESNFDFLILESIEEDKLLSREQFYLDTFMPYKREIGYNIGIQSFGGDNFTNNPNKENIRQLLSDVNLNDKNPMYGKKHKSSSISKQKEKSVGRYTLDWFKTKYGDEEGVIQYKIRNEKLSNRNINYTYDNGLTGKKRGPMSEENKRKISESKIRFKQRKDEFVNDLKLGTFTIKELSEKYEISAATVKAYKRKIYDY
jgi:group I intron endonuclease